MYTHCTHIHYFILFILGDQDRQIGLLWPDQMFQVKKKTIFISKWVNYYMYHCFVVFFRGKMIWKHTGQLIIMFIKQQRDTENRETTEGLKNNQGT